MCPAGLRPGKTEKKLGLHASATGELIFWQMGARSADRSQMVALAERYQNAAGSSLIFSIGGLALIVGLVLLTVAMWRTGAAPGWAALALPLGAVVNIVGFSLASNALLIASNLILLGGFGWIGRGLLNASPTGNQVPETSATRLASSTS